MKRAKFIISSALFEELGERLVSKPEIALAELVKNAYDADSPSCALTINENRIVVADTGHGMTEEEFLNNWMVVSGQNKGLQRFSRVYQRHMAGSKGVGRFSARFLGNVVELTTVAVSKTGSRCRLTATFDWRKIAAETKVSDVTIGYTVERVGPTVPTGTILTISSLRDEAKDISTSKVKSDILKLTDPASGLEAPPFKWTTPKKPAERDPGFEVSFGHDASNEDAGLADNVAAELLNAYVGRVRIFVDQRGQLNYKVFWDRGQRQLADGTIDISDIAKAYSAAEITAHPGQPADARGLHKGLEQVPHLPVSEGVHSPIFIDLRFFPKRQGTFSKLNLDGRVAQSWLVQNASLAIVDNTFAMPAYIDRDSDWLGIDASKARNERDWQSIFTPSLFPMTAGAKADPGRNPMLALPRATQLVGRVHIATRTRPGAGGSSDKWLQPNMDRESLRQNGAFRLLWHVSRFAVELLAHFDRKLRLKAEEQKAKRDQKEVQTAISAAIAELKVSREIEPQFKRRLVSRLEEAQSRAIEAEQYDEEARLALELMSMMGVMAGFMTHEFDKTLALIRETAATIESAAEVRPELGEHVDAIRENEVTLANYLDYMRLFVERAREAKPQEFKARAQVNLAAKTLGSLMQAHGINFELDIDSKLIGPHIPIAAYNGIVINFISNAMKALVPKVSDEPRRIRIYASNDTSRHTLVCSDNGIGIPEYLRKRIWDPLFTTTADDDNPLGSGLGLGLSLVKQVVEKLGGRIELMNEAAHGFATSFRVSLPLAAES